MVAFYGVKARRGRAALTSIGIGIGIAAIVAVTGISASGRADLLATLESLGTGTSYPNENIWGARWGLGWKSIQDEGKGMVLKVLAEYNDYETVVLNGNASDGKVNKIEADPEAYGLKLSIGFNF